MSIVPDQIGFGRSSKPIIPYNFHDMARNTFAILQNLKIAKAMVVGHSMGGMLAARFASQYPDVVERVVMLQPDRPRRQPLRSPDRQRRRGIQAATLAATYQTVRAGVRCAMSRTTRRHGRLSSRAIARVRYAWTLSADWPRLAMVQAVAQQMLTLDPVVN